MFLVYFLFNYLANIERGKAIFYNPSGLGINSGYEIYSSKKDTLLEIGFTLNNFGFGLKKEKDLNNFLLAFGIPIDKKIYLGYRYKFIKELNKIEHLGSLTYRPMSYLSFSFNISTDKNFNLGIGLRPISERINLYFDYDKEFKYLMGTAIEIFDGLLINGEINKDKKINLGISFSFSHFKISSAYGEKKLKAIELNFSRERYPTIFKKPKKIIEVTLSGNYEEDYYEQSLFLKKREPRFYRLLKNLETILEKEDVFGIFLRLKDYNLSLTQYEELRELLLDFKKANKKIIIYADYYKNLKEYYLVSIADYIILNKGGMVDISGILLKKFYLKKLLQKLGIEAEVLAIGKYKSAKELYLRADMSEEDKEQLNEILDTTYEKIKSEINSSRPALINLDSLIDNIGYFNEEKAKEFKLIDTVLFPKEIDKFLKSYTKVKKVKLEDYLKEKDIERSWFKKKKRIALVIAEGTIVEGKSGYDPTPIIGGKYIGSETMEDIFNRLEKDRSIKAVIFRVNSGGGQATASEIIASAVKKCNEKKPVIVSFGNVAASGGYFISSPAKKIFADYFTITGSIGIFSVKAVTRKFYDEKLGITFDYLKRGAMADATSDLRSYTEKEKEIFYEELEWWYNKFLEWVSKGRKLKKEYVDSIGQGRVWLGKKAKELGLVDEIGSLRKVIKEVKRELGIKKDEEIEIITYPKEEKKFLVAFPKVNIYDLLKARFLYLLPENIIIE
jgi:protease-4